MAKSKGNQQQEKQTASENRQESGQQTRSSNRQTGLSRHTGGAPGGFPNPFSLMRRFGEDMEQLFDEFGFGRLMPRSFGEVAAWTPQVEVFQRDDELIIRADLPGINKDNVKVELRDDSVILHGERQEERKEEREGFYRTERSYGSFYREIPLPAGVDTSKATANFRDGVLEITMPAEHDQARGRQLEIQDSVPAEQSKQKAQAAGASR